MGAKPGDGVPLHRDLGAIVVAQTRSTAALETKAAQGCAFETSYEGRAACAVEWAEEPALWCAPCFAAALTDSAEEE